MYHSIKQFKSYQMILRSHIFGLFLLKIIILQKVSFFRSILKEFWRCHGETFSTPTTPKLTKQYKMVMGKEKYGCACCAQRKSAVMSKKRPRFDWIPRWVLDSHTITAPHIDWSPRGTHNPPVGDNPLLIGTPWGDLGHFGLLNCAQWKTRAKSAQLGKSRRKMEERRRRKRKLGVFNSVWVLGARDLIWRAYPSKSRAFTSWEAWRWTPGSWGMGLMALIGGNCAKW